MAITVTGANPTVITAVSNTVTRHDVPRQPAQRLELPVAR